MAQVIENKRKREARDAIQDHDEAFETQQDRMADFVAIAIYLDYKRGIILNGHEMGDLITLIQ